ncbi:hypothetical protein BDV96DRAFT_483847 [Lophiotrema nucula]|uniref:Uncharacterized protein n=1 Tax=Lophiotrema nucula TaxID=690887 RepID=A0A6A5ZR16_9PLEO|nr:hypothetical protein BDV96DRAFT_483847 [Lophiotrema nucula]
MKRKRALSAETPAKRLDTKDSAAKHGNRLIQALTQYGILQSVTGNLFPKDLCALAATSKAAYATVLPNQESLSSLLRLMSCDGSGVRLRQRFHRKSKYFEQFDCQEHVRCTNEDKQGIMSRPCISCGITTCNECRVHCVYQSIYQPPEDYDELPNYSGFALLEELEMGILSPEHFGVADMKPWQRPISGRYTPHHDQGFLDIPLESEIYALPESIDLIIDSNLGSGPLKGAAASESPYPSPVIQGFWNITESRKRKLCVDCFARRQTSWDTKCSCTLRSRFLDRWLCLHCFRREQRDEQEASQSEGCDCGQPLLEESSKLICLWCNGEVVNTT